MIPISELSRRGLLDTGEDVDGAGAEADGSGSPATEARQDDNGSRPPAPTSAPTVDRKPDSGPATEPPSLDVDDRADVGRGARVADGQAGR
jgi:hypothetical protein